MTLIGRASQLIGRPVVTLDTATAVGEVKDVLVDPERSVAVAFTLRGRGLLGPPLVGYLPAESVRSTGRDALMIDAGTALLRQREGLGMAIGEQPEVIGRQVVTQRGAALGTVSDVLLELGGPQAAVVGYEIEGGDGQRLLIPVAGGVSFSADALIVPVNAEAYAANGLAGFRAALARARQDQLRSARMR